MTSKPVWILLFLACLFTYATVKSEIDIRQKAKAEVDLRYLPSSQMARFMALDFNEAMSDLFWIEGLNYFGSQLTSKHRTYKYLGAYIELISGLDAYFKVFYDWAATAFIYNGLDVTREGVCQSTHYANAGIRNLASIFRYDDGLLQKAAFNYALETKYREPSLPYFEMAGRIFPTRRDLLLVASSYASIIGNYAYAHELKLEYLGFIALEAPSQQDLNYAIGIISSPKFNTYASTFVRSLRLQLEKDEDLKKIVETRLQSNPFHARAMESPVTLDEDRRYLKVLTLNRKRNWLPPAMQLLLM